ncbi:hypothetical protein LCGC14_2595250 [marine sediment metagenome]|uniref:Uncharacterized protein n=1 Tax=marine sediment metagenome TaxID=412755 RepID=A0A0F9AYC1_9ZZZZ
MGTHTHGQNGECEKGGCWGKADSQVRIEETGSTFLFCDHHTTKAALHTKRAGIEARITPLSVRGELAIR